MIWRDPVVWEIASPNWEHFCSRIWASLGAANVKRGLWQILRLPKRAKSDKMLAFPNSFSLWSTGSAKILLSISFLKSSIFAFGVQNVDPLLCPVLAGCPLKFGLIFLNGPFTTLILFVKRPSWVKIRFWTSAIELGRDKLLWCEINKSIKILRHNM